jgi:hypothetical protein
MVATECRYIGLDMYYSVAATKFEDFWPVNRTIEDDPRCCRAVSSLECGVFHTAHSAAFSISCAIIEPLMRWGTIG